MVAGEINGIPYLGFISPLHRQICEQKLIRKLQPLYSDKSEEKNPRMAQPVLHQICKQPRPVQSAPEPLTKRLARMVWK